MVQHISLFSASCSSTCIKMEAAAAAACPSLTFTSSICPPLSSPSPSLLVFSSRSPLSATPIPVTSLCLKSSQARHLLHLSARRERSWTALQSSATDSAPSNSSEKWILEPVGDGDYRHIGFKVPLPKTFEIASNVVIVGRVAEKANVVIPVATVSGVHARLEKKEGTLLVTDLNSTNGTFINDKRLTPGVTTVVLPGNLLTFGDTNLAIFRVSKVEVLESPSKVDESETEVVTNITNNMEITS